MFKGILGACPQKKKITSDDCSVPAGRAVTTRRPPTGSGGLKQAVPSLSQINGLGYGLKKIRA